MLNSNPLNSGPLNRLWGGASGAAVELEPGDSFVWDIALTLGGTDVSASLAGAVRISRPEQGDSVCSFALWLGPDPVDIAAYTGMPVQLDFVLLGEAQTSVRRFTGYLVQPEFDVLSRVLSCEATTRLADSIETMPFEQIDLLVGGWWSADVFEPREGRSRWEYAQERLSTQTVSLSVTMNGQPRITNWYSAGTSYVFTQGSTLYQSLDVALASLSDTTNVVELELDYRYTRYRQRYQRYSWQHPGTGGLVGVQGLLAWREDSTELPDIPMIIQATEQAGWWVAYAEWYRLPGDLPNLPQPWYNKNTDLLLGADWRASIRWTQRAVERYPIRLEIPAAVAAVGEVIARERVVLDTDTDSDRLWEESRGAAGGLVGDDEPETQLPRRDQARLDNAVLTALHRAKAQLLAAQRGNLVSWQIPLAHALGVDLGQRLKLDDQACITGTVTELTDDLDMDTGAALLTITLAVSQGAENAVADPLVVPDAPAFVDDWSPNVPVVQPTQLGLRIESPPYDESLPGFAGNYSIGNGAPEDRYPRRFAVDTPEIPAQWRDEIAASQSSTYRVAPPIDLLEI
ncbi:hypothetical protein ACFSB1_10690 [Halopseudomonas phragmitis]|uniref:Uncharacterized protein n=1 Tax=Halopseudomonas phragmitis TaxID=1931241 RepID=A0A1V0B9I5_9GAMM|nr:hypothetical protein [Halopseudomonas phragmitis]AQZ96551.1 hypothetical protein BVH74_18135 [Halopseudomonas phragmitis]